MITLENDCLEFRFPEVHEEAHCSIVFQRTLRIPDDGKDYPLPPGLGPFPLQHLDDHAPRIPEDWLRRGGVVMPMHQAEAMWLDFGSHSYYPFAVKIATGKICAITGEPWVDRLNGDPQDYVVLPNQPWLDGYCVERGTIRQFIAMPLGEGYTVEEQLTSAGRHGGLQIVAYPMKAERYTKLIQDQLDRGGDAYLSPPILAGFGMDMGLAPGGRMQQEIYDDPHGLDAWDQRHASRCFVSIVNSVQWLAVTGGMPPGDLPTAKQYTDAGLPWFDYYDGDVKAVAGAQKLKAAKSVVKIGIEKGETPLPGNETLDMTHVIGLRKSGVRQVRESPASEAMDS